MGRLLILFCNFFVRKKRYDLDRCDDVCDVLDVQLCTPGNIGTCSLYAAIRNSGLLVLAKRK